jgi:hypothetical protein
LEKLSSNCDREAKILLKSVRIFREEVDYLEVTVKQIKSNDKLLKISREKLEDLQ